MSVSGNFFRIQTELNAFRGLTILGVTKKQPKERVAEAVNAGLRLLGNNYVQEGEELRKEFGKVEWHFIGHIQSRKAKDVVCYDLVQSVDRLSVAQSLDKKLKEMGRTLSVLVEVNIGNEQTKFGIAPAEVDLFFDELSLLSSLRIRGLMGMPPPLDEIELRRPYFQSLRKIFERYATSGFDILSMGTSEDYLIAAQEGATLVRLGTALFGNRAIKEN